MKVEVEEYKTKKMMRNDGNWCGNDGQNMLETVIPDTEGTIGKMMKLANARESG